MSLRAGQPDSETASWAVIKGSSGIGFKGLLQRGATQSELR